MAKAAVDRPTTPTLWFEMIRRARERLIVAETATVLIADDDEDFRSFARTVLEATIDGVQVTCVSDGARALESIHRASYALLLLDLEMPKANGLEVMAALRERPVDQRPVVVVISATGTAADWALLSRLGADSFLVKPVGPEQLARTVRRLLGPGSIPPG